MNLLLDTHTFVWWRDSPEKLSKSAFDAISDLENEVYFSTVSAWEIQIKLALKKIELKWTLEKSIDVEQAANGFQILLPSLRHVYNIENLPSFTDHKDPFDRMLISQAMVEDMTIVTADNRFSDYDVKVLW